jgi:hypothetical protein
MAITIKRKDKLGDPSVGPQGPKKVHRAIAVGDPGHKKFTLNNTPVTRTKAKTVLGPLFTSMDKSAKKVTRKVQDTGAIKKLVAEMQGGRTSVPPGTTINTKTRAPKGKAKTIKKRVK